MADMQTKAASGTIPKPNFVAASSAIPVVRESAPPAHLLGRGMSRASFGVILMLVASFTFLDYWAYSVDYHLHPATYDLFLRGQGAAPAQYRVGLIFAARAVRSATHLALRHSFAIFDFLFSLAAAYLLRNVLTHTRAFREAAPVSRWLRMAILLGLISFYLSWTLWYQRPETMACAFYVAGSLYLLTVVRSKPLMIVGLLALSIWQGVVRSDVAILFHFGLFVFVLLRGAKGYFASRGLLLATSFVCCAVATAILWLLMHKIFPHATYGDTAVFQLRTNLSLAQLIPFFLFILPTIYTYRRASARFASLDGPQGSLLLICLLYLGSWALVGRLQEVRIFVPFAWALMPMTANFVGDQVEAAAS